MLDMKRLVCLLTRDRRPLPAMRTCCKAEIMAGCIKGFVRNVRVPPELL